MTPRDRLLQILNTTGPSWIIDPHGILGQPRAVPEASLVALKPEPSEAPLPPSEDKSKKPEAWLANLGGGEKIGIVGGPDMYVRSLTSNDESVTIAVNEDGTEVDFSVVPVVVDDTGGFIQVDYDADTNTYTVSLAPQPGSGVRYLTYAADGTPTLEDQKTIPVLDLIESGDFVRYTDVVFTGTRTVT